MDIRLINHRRDRQQTRRVLAEMMIRGRDLTGPFFQTEFDLLDRQSRLRVQPQHSSYERNRR